MEMPHASRHNPQKTTNASAADLQAEVVDSSISSFGGSSALASTTHGETANVHTAQRNPGVPLAMVDHWLRDAARLLEAATKEPPKNLDALRVTYEKLGESTGLCEAAMRSTLDVLDERNDGPSSPDAAGFQRTLQRSFDSLRQCGVAFAALSADFSALVHGPSSWPSRPVELVADRGDGQPLVGYENTFKSASSLSTAEREAAFEQRVEKFLGRGGDFEDIIVAKPGIFDTLPSGVHHDYVLLPDGTLRLFENAKDDDSGPPKPGHSLLATGNQIF
jgi:hypothetical protein